MKLNLTVYRNEVVPVYTTDKGNQVVNARELHKFLEIPDVYRNWVKYKIKVHKFVENVDYVTFEEKSSKGRPTKEYVFLLDPAKKIAMGTNNAQGDKVKDYFLALEREKNGARPTNILNMADHMKREVQLENSKAAGALVFREEGLENTKDYFRKTCQMACGLGTTQVKRIGKQRGLKSKDCASARQVLRKINPPAAGTLSFIDAAYRAGASLDKIEPLAPKAKELFAGMLAIGVIPGELTA